MRPILAMIKFLPMISKLVITAILVNMKQEQHKCFSNSNCAVPAPGSEKKYFFVGLKYSNIVLY